MNPPKPARVPPLTELIAKIKSLGADRAALVREANPGRPEGLLIMMLSDQAIRDLGPIIIAHTKSLNLPPEHARHAIHMDEQVTGAEFFRELERLNLRFAYIQRKELNATIAILLGGITEDLCRALTLKGCPTRLK